MPFGILVRSPRPSSFWLVREGAMVGRDDLQRAGAQAVPEIVLVVLVAEGRRHHAARRMRPVGVEILAPSRTRCWISGSP